MRRDPLQPRLGHDPGDPVRADRLSFIGEDFVRPRYAHHAIARGVVRPDAPE